ncbi:MAG: LON peptidase substrate-binding domain-containing protein [Candidatus Methylomirabilia bacterium]
MDVHLSLFPLPNVVFFPHTTLPLHIFEPRYRQMVADCLNADKRLAVVLLKPGWEADYYGRPPVYPVAGAGEITQWERLPDGRYNILLRGLGRILIDGEAPSERPYRIANAHWLDDVHPPGGEQGLAPQMEQLRHVLGQLLSQLPQPVPRLLEVLTDRNHPGALVDRIASVVTGEVDRRQSLLETLDVAGRMAEVTEYLQEVLSQRVVSNPRWQAKWN